jgi:hypothetical protein
VGYRHQNVGSLQKLTEVMRKPVKESDVTWDTVELLIPGAQLTVWSHDERTPFPNLDDEPDLDDLTPDESVTKQLWINLYEDIERWRNYQH